MTESEIESLINKIVLFQKEYDKNKDSEIKRDIEKAKEQLMKICENLHFFNKKIISNKIVRDKTIINDIFSNLEFVFFKEDEAIWEIGDKINEMYIIFLGEVGIYKQKIIDDEDSILEYTLLSGYSLGEEVFTNRYIYRTNKAKAKTFCILGRLSFIEYKRIFNKFLYEQNILINCFLKDLHLFNFDYIEKLQRHMFLKYYNKNEYIFRQNEPFDTFYLIYSGTIRLIINLEKSVKSKIDQDLLIGNNNKRFTSSRLFELRGYYKEQVNYNLMDLTIGDIIGGVEYLNHYGNYKYDVKCLTDVEVLKVDLINFNKILIEGERLLFEKKIKNQMELISDRLKAVKERRNKIHIKDFILSKSKFTKTFLLNHPISKKNEYKAELLINCGLNPVKIRRNKFKIFHLNISKISSNIMEEYNKSKNYKRKYSNKHLNLSKDFLTNIGSNNKTQINDIFPSYNTIQNNMPYKNKKIFLITDENKKVDKKLLFKNKTTTTPLLLNLKNKKKDNVFNIKSNSIAKYQSLFKNKRVIFSDNKKIYLKSQSKNNINNKLLSLNNSRYTYKKEFHTINND